ncbi:MAG: hypothetical protein DLM61_12290, partial [Pseudonocardiales bacterium]
SYSKLGLVDVALMDVRLHHDTAEFTALTRPLLEADPIRHTVVLTVLALLARVPQSDEGPPVLLSVHRDGVLADWTGVHTAAVPRAWLRQCGHGGSRRLGTAGAREHVVLHTDLANQISNAIYPRIGFRPMHDAVEITFTPAPRR